MGNLLDAITNAELLPHPRQGRPLKGRRVGPFLSTGQMSRKQKVRPRIVLLRLCDAASYAVTWYPGAFCCMLCCFIVACCGDAMQLGFLLHGSCHSMPS